MKPEVSSLLPHSSSMLLVQEIISSGDFSAVVGATIKDEYPFSVRGTGSWLGLELMAQAAAVISKLRCQTISDKPSLGFLLGSRSFVAHVPEFFPGQKVHVEVKLDPDSEGQSTISATGAIRDSLGQLLCEGSLTLFEPNDDALYLTK